MSDDAMADLRALYEAGRTYVAAYAAIVAPPTRVHPDNVAAIVEAVGEINVNEACAALDRLALEADA